jgi:2-methylcitrate dehydratase PrpD
MRKRRIRPADVEKIEVEVPARGIRHSGNTAPTSDISARISIPYVVSAVIAFYEDVLRDPHFTELYSDEKLIDEERAQLALRVTVIGSRDLEEGFDREWPMRFGSNVTIRLKSGAEVKGTAEIWSVSSHQTDQQVIDKFIDVAGRVLGPDRVQSVADQVFRIDDSVTLDELVAAVCW